MTTKTSADFPHAGVLGFGTMGAGIAQVLAASGRTVTVLETERPVVESGRRRVERFLDDGVARGEVTDADRIAVLDRIRCTVAPGDLATVDVVIDSVPEDVGVKRSALAAIAEVVGSHVPLLTNTSALSVTELAAELPNPGRVAGLHFFNPAPTTRTVEVIAGMRTSDHLIERLVAFVETLEGKAPITVKDRPGFLVNALLLPYLNDAIQEFDDGLATAEDIDVALQLGLGYKTGPFAMLDSIGLDVHLHTTAALHAATLDARYAPPPLLRRMVAADRLGDKVGRGFRVNTSEGGSATTHDGTSR